MELAGAEDRSFPKGRAREAMISTTILVSAEEATARVTVRNAAVRVVIVTEGKRTSEATLDRQRLALYTGECQFARVDLWTLPESRLADIPSPLHIFYFLPPKVYATRSS